MPDRAYPNRPTVNNLGAVALDLRAAWSIDRRLAWAWGGNPNHGSETWSRRRTRLEHRYGRADAARDHLAVSIERLMDKGQLDKEHAELARVLRATTPEHVGAIHLRRVGADEAKRRTPYYLPAAAMAAAGLVVKLVKRANQLLRALTRASWRASLRAVASRTRAAVAALYQPQEPSPPDPDARRKEAISSKPAPLNEELAAWLARMEAKRRARAAEQEREQ